MNSSALVLASAVSPVPSLTAHHSRPMKATLNATHTIDQLIASLTPTSCAPCLRRTTKSRNSDTTTMPTKTAHNQVGTIVLMKTPCKNGADCTDPQDTRGNRATAVRPKGLARLAPGRVGDGGPV